MRTPPLLSLLSLCALIVPRALAFWIAAAPPPPPRQRLFLHYATRGDSDADGRQPQKGQHQHHHHHHHHSRADALRSLLGHTTAAAVVASTTAFPFPGAAGAATVGGGSSGGKEAEQQQRTYREKGRPALLEALVYLPKGVSYWGELLEGGSDEDPATGAEALFLTASYEGRLVLGARVPMQGIMFPFLAQFYPRNVISGPGARSAEAAWEAVKDKDLVVRARVCATGEYPPCETPLLRAASLSKFLPVVLDPNNAKSKNGTGSGGEEEQEVIARNVRIGASLMLRPPGAATTLEEIRRVGGVGGGGVAMPPTTRPPTQ